MPAAVCFPAMVYEEQCHCVGAFIITVMTNNFRLTLWLSETSGLSVTQMSCNILLLQHILP